jgi:hypothetical protein
VSTADGNIFIKAFIEGIEVPVSSVSLTESIWSPPSLEMAIPAHPLVRSLAPRSLVHVFYYDTDGFDFVRQEATGSDTSATIADAGFDIFPVDDARKYKLLFCGELHGLSIERVAVGGSSIAQLRCVGLFSYLSGIKQYQAVRGAGTVSDDERRFAGVEDAFTTGSSGRYGTANSILNILREGGDNFQESVHTLITEFIVRTNEFYKSRSKILRFEDILRTVTNDDTLERLLDMSVFRRFLRQRISSSGQQITMADVLNTVLGFLFHDMVAHGTPSYFPFVSEDTSRDLSSDSREESQPVVDRAAQVDKLVSWVVKPELWWASPPACNILFPEHYASVSESYQPVNEPTRTVMKIQPGVSGHRRTICDNFFAPDSQSLNELAEAVPLSDQHVFLLPHERFLGVNTNFQFINEVARLVNASDYRDYMRSYAQFMHWRSVLGIRQATVSSQRPLPQVLVGYPVVVMDPRLHEEVRFDASVRDERARLARLLAALRACLTRLLRRLAALLERLRRLRTVTDYYIWLEHVYRMPYRQCIQDTRRNLPLEGPNGFRWETSTSWDIATTHHHLRIRTEGGMVRPRRADPRVNMPDPDRQILMEYLQSPFAIDNNGRCHYPPSTTGFWRDLQRHKGVLEAVIESVESEISHVRGLISRVREAIDEIMRYLRTFGYEDRPIEHLIFYAMSKTTSFSVTNEGGQCYVSIQGMGSRLHNEDIDLDGNRGDSFDNIIKTGTGGFFSDIYDAPNIGDQFYNPIYGVGSLIDVGAQMQSILMERGNPEVEVDDSIQRSPDEVRWQAIVEEICDREWGDTTGTEGFDVEMALDALSEAYKLFRESGHDMEHFVTGIVSRPIATMVDILGTGVLTTDRDRSEYGNYHGSNRAAGVGFHEFAFIKEEDGEESFDTSDLESGESDQLDVATARRDRVLAYVNAIKAKMSSQ